MKRTAKKTVRSPAPRKNSSKPPSSAKKSPAPSKKARSPIPSEPLPLEETTNYRPTLKAIRVPLADLLFDPNNPRILHDEAIPESQYASSGVQTQAHERMKAGDYRLEKLKQSILENGWQPVDMVFVKKLANGTYVVLEGNRRLTALRSISQDEMPPGLREAIDPLPVLEVVGNGNPEEARAQVTYLLGVRHHGSLKVWAPFARAHAMYERYLQAGKMTDATFTWKDAIAEQIAKTLSVDADAVEEALKVYRVMKQLHSHGPIATVGMQGRYYSLVREVLSRPAKSPLRQYVATNPATFALDGPSIDRIDKVCRFSTEGRTGAPVNSPVEWRSLEKILKDEDEAKRTSMLHQVEEEHRQPSLVYAMRAAELRQPRWDRWLKEVAGLLNGISVGGFEETDEARTVSKELAELLDGLNAMAETAKGTNP